MVTLEDAVIARLETHGEQFEILVDPDAIQAIRHDEPFDINEVLAIDTVFKDSKKGDKASEEKLQEIFETTDVESLVKIIVKKGSVQLTTEQRRLMQEEKKKQIIAHISTNAVNPQTNTPHPPTRIELAMEDAGVHIDPFKTVDQQINDIIAKLRAVLPLSFEKMQIAVRLPGQEYGRLYGTITSYGKLLREEWQTNGSWIGVVEIPAGRKGEFFDEVNSKTKGNSDLKILKEK